MIRPPPRSTRTDTLLPYTTLFRSGVLVVSRGGESDGGHLSFSFPFKGKAGMGMGFGGGAWVCGGGWETHPLPTLPLKGRRSEEHTSELQSLMRISYAVFCLKKKNKCKHTYSKSSQR